MIIRVQTRIYKKFQSIHLDYSIIHHPSIRPSIDPFMESKIKCFYKKTRKRGKVVKIVEEKYYRSDIDCGYLFSNLNTNDHDDDDEVMDVSASSSSIDANSGISVDSLKQMVHHAAHKQLLLIDTNIALHQIDVLEYNCSATALVVVLQTVLQELKHLNTSVYRRMLELMKTPTKSFIFYPNEASYHTAVFRCVVISNHCSTQSKQLCTSPDMIDL
jgi:hypothetical protein